MRDVNIDDGYDWPGEEEKQHVKEEDFSAEEVKQGYNSTPMEREPKWGNDVRTSVRQRAVGKEETYSRRQKT